MENNKFEKERLVTIAVDVQNDFCTGGLLAVKNGEDVTTPLNELFNLTRQNHGQVILTRDIHPAETPHFNTWPVHCVEGTIGANFRDELLIKEDDVIINKGTEQTDGYSGFSGKTKDGTTLEELVKPRNLERVSLLIGGLATDYCVLQTTLDALKIAEKVRQSKIGKMTVYLVENAIRAVNINPYDGQNAIKEMVDAGAIITNTTDIITNQITKELK